MTLCVPVDQFTASTVETLGWVSVKELESGKELGKKQGGFGEKKKRGEAAAAVVAIIGPVGIATHVKRYLDVIAQCGSP